MKYLKRFNENFKVSVNDIIKCINSGGTIETNIIKDLPDNPKEVKPVSVEDTGEVTVEVNGDYYEVDLKHIKKINF